MDHDESPASVIPTLSMRSRLSLVALIVLVCPACLAAQARPGALWESVGRILRAPGTEKAGTHRYNMPRFDLTVQVGDVTIAPQIALVAWAGFGVAGPDTVVMGDLVVTADELGPVLRQLAADAIDVTAVHNHLVGESPQVTYMHYMARGSPLDLAHRLRRTLDQTGAALRAPKTEPVTIDTALVFRELGARGRASGPVAQLGFDLVAGPVTLRGHALPPAIAYGSPINIQRVSATRAVATGDFAVVAEKVDPILDALARHGIVTTAVHSHMVGESPPLYYIHFWADSALPDVLRGLRAALDAAR